MLIDDGTKMTFGATTTSFDPSQHRMTPDIAELATALAAAQGEFESVIASRKGQDGNRKYAYADLDAFLTACRAVLSRHGLSVIQRPMPSDGKTVRLETLLMHKSGQWVGSEIVLPVAQETAKAYGSALTYARRYSLQAIVALAATEDDDGDAAVQAPPRAPIPPAAASVRMTGHPLMAGTRAEILRLAAAIGWTPDKLREVLTAKGKQRLDDLTEAEGAGLRQALERKELETQAAAAF